MVLKKLTKLSAFTVLMLALVILLSLLLAGCGAKQNTPAKDGAKPAEVKTVKIAFLGPLTGPSAAQGVGARNSFKLAVKEANESGKFPFNIEVMDLDDGSNPATGASMAQKAVADSQVVAASGHWNSPVAEATIPIFKNAGIPLQIWGAISPTLTKKENYPYITRICPTMPQQTVPLAKFAVDKLGVKKWAVISDVTVLGKAALEGWKKEMEARPDAELVSVDEIQVGTTDFRPILTKIKNKQPKGIFLGLVTMEAALITKQMQELKMDDVMIVSLSGIVEDKYIEVASPKGAEGAIGAKPGKAIDQLPGGKEFVAAYEKAGYKEPMGAYGPYAYDSAKIILKALEQVGPDKAKLADAIAKINYSGLIGNSSFDETGQTKNVEITEMVVDDGKWVPYAESKYAKGTKIRGTN